MGTILILILLAVIILAVLGIGLSNFFSAVMKGAEKVKNIPVVKNITDTASIEFNKIINNVSKDTISNIGKSIRS